MGDIWRVYSAILYKSKWNLYILVFEYIPFVDDEAFSFRIQSRALTKRKPIHSMKCSNKNKNYTRRLTSMKSGNDHYINGNGKSSSSSSTSRSTSTASQHVIRQHTSHWLIRMLHISMFTCHFTHTNDIMLWLFGFGSFVEHTYFKLNECRCSSLFFSSLVLFYIYFPKLMNFIWNCWEMKFLASFTLLVF